MSRRSFNSSPPSHCLNFNYALGASFRVYRTDATLTVAYIRGMTETEAAVLDAARKWLAAKEAILAADARLEDWAKTEHAFDDAEYELTTAVYRLLGREAKPPRG